MKSLQTFEIVEKIINGKSGFIKKWQLLVWVKKKIRSGEFDDLIKKLIAKNNMKFHLLDATYHPVPDLFKNLKILVCMSIHLETVLAE